MGLEVSAIEYFDENVKKMNEFIEYASNTYPIDPNKKLIIGFSQGAIPSMTLDLALVLGEKIKGIIPMQGYIPTFVNEENI
jgi:phospholipase/carboxylesterase